MCKSHYTHTRQGTVIAFLYTLVSSSLFTSHADSLLSQSIASFDFLEYVSSLGALIAMAAAPMGAVTRMDNTAMVRIWWLIDKIFIVMSNHFNKQSKNQLCCKKCPYNLVILHIIISVVN